MLGSPPPATYQPFSMNRQNSTINNVPGVQGLPASPLGMSSSSYMPPSSMSMPSSASTPSSYMQPSSYMPQSNMPQNPNPDPNAQNQINMMLKALQGGVQS